MSLSSTALRAGRRARQTPGQCQQGPLKEGPAAQLTSLSLLEPSYPSSPVSGSRGRVFVLREVLLLAASVHRLLSCPQERAHQGNVCPYKCLFAHTTRLYIWLGRLVHMQKWARKHRGLDGQIGSVVSFILCEGAARGYLDTAAVRGALQESFVFQVLPSNSLNSPQIRRTVWGRILTQVLDPSSAPSCNDALRNSDLKQTALPRAGSTCPYGCQEAALNCQELGCVSRSKDGNKTELEYLLQPSRVPVAVVVSSNRDLAGPALAERRVFLAVAFLSSSNSHFTSFKQRSVGDCLQRLRQCTHI